jgi:hypothetical protein
VKLICTFQIDVNVVSLSRASRCLFLYYQAEIQPDRMVEFLKMIQTNAEQTRKEPGCIRFGGLENVVCVRFNRRV